MSLMNARVRKSHTATDRPYYGRGLNGPMLFWVLLAPSLILFIGIIFYPLFNTFLLTFQSMNLADPLDNSFVGLKNYISVLTNPTWDFWGSAGFSVFFSIVVTVLSFLIGLLFALILNQRLRFQTLWRGLALIPWVIPYVVVAYLFFYMFNSQYGIVNQLLTSFNLFGWHPITAPLAWFGGNGNLAIVAVIFATVWNKFPFFTLMLLAGLQTVQQELLDAATVDGAGLWARFWHVTVPQLRGIIVVVTTLQLIWSLNEYTIIYSMTQGGPGNATNNIIINIYRTGFMNEDISIAATIGILWLIILLFFTNFYIRIMEGKAGGA
ncbi:ABC transporter permease [Ktedonobacteria bacterium brp13]|nr:ABC transporter permease [Ktedonobacteria bacterium brp13]